MITGNGFRIVVAAIGIAGIAGCRYFDKRTTRRTPAKAEEKAPEVSPRQAADMQVALGKYLEKQNNVAGATAAYRTATKHDPNRADAYWRLAILHDLQGRFAESEELFRRAIHKAPDSPDILCDFGYNRYLQKHWDEAELNLRKAIARSPRHRRAHNNLGLLLARTNRLDEALAEFHKAGCSEADAEQNVAFALTLESRWDEARRHYKLALLADPGSESASQGLQDLNSLIVRAGRESMVPKVQLAKHESQIKGERPKSPESRAVSESNIADGPILLISHEASTVSHLLPAKDETR